MTKRKKLPVLDHLEHLADKKPKSDKPECFNQKEVYCDPDLCEFFNICQSKSIK